MNWTNFFLQVFLIHTIYNTLQDFSVTRKQSKSSSRMPDARFSEFKSSKIAMIIKIKQLFYFDQI